MERSDKRIHKYTHLEKDGFKGRGRPHKTRSATILKVEDTDANNAQDRPVWKKALRIAMKSPTHKNCGQVTQNGYVISPQDFFSTW